MEHCFGDVYLIKFFLSTIMGTSLQCSRIFLFTVLFFRSWAFFDTNSSVQNLLGAFCIQVWHVKVGIFFHVFTFSPELWILMATEVTILVERSNKFLRVALDEAVNCQAHHGSHKSQKYDEAK